MNPTDPKTYQVQIAWESFLRNVWKEHQGPEEDYAVFQRSLVLAFTDGLPEYVWPNLTLWLAKKLVPLAQGNGILAQPPVFLAIIDDRYARFNQDTEIFDLLTGAETKPFEGVKHKVYNLTALARRLKTATDAVRSLEGDTKPGEEARQKLEQSQTDR